MIFNGVLVNSKLAMIVINKYTKRSSHVTSMSINDKLVIKFIYLRNTETQQFIVNINVMQVGCIDEPIKFAVISEYGTACLNGDHDQREH